MPELSPERIAAIKRLAEAPENGGRSIIVPGESILALIVMVEERDARIAKLEARLEIDHAFKADPQTGDLVRFEIRPEDRDKWPDGIECRDETIKLVEDRNSELRVEIASLKATSALERLASSAGEGEWLAYNEPLTSTASPNIICGVVLVKKSDVPDLWRRTHPDHSYTDEQAIDEFMIVNWAWPWPASPPQAPESRAEAVAWRIKDDASPGSVRRDGWFFTGFADAAENYRASGHLVEPLFTRPPEADARQIVCEEWQRAVREFGFAPGSNSAVERVVGRILNRIDAALAATSGEKGQGT